MQAKHDSGCECIAGTRGVGDLTASQPDRTQHPAVHEPEARTGRFGQAMLIV